MTTDNTLSFTELDRRLRDMPDGPAAILDTPKPYRIANLIGGVVAVLTFVPFVLIQFMPPERWMVVWAQVGFSVFLLALLPGLVRSYGVLGWTLWTWRADQVSQLDHDLPQFRTILAWLSAQPQHALTEHHRVARLTLAQISVRIGMFTGGLERLGVLPVLVSAWLFLRNWKDLLDMPLWQLLLGVGLMLFYVVMTVGNLKRIRLQLYESLLAEALAMKAASGTAP
nr:hypothetical protein [uncultured Pseudoxanthomonas sp.]